MSEALRKKLDRYANLRGPELTDREVGILYDSLSDLLGVLGEKIDARIKNLQDQRYEISEKISDLEGAWSEHDHDFMRSEGLLSPKDLHFIADFHSAYQVD
jgi:hypothetical protein